MYTNYTSKTPKPQIMALTKITNFGGSHGYSCNIQTILHYTDITNISELTGVVELKKNNNKKRQMFQIKMKLCLTEIINA